jgi:hypothetical protein
MGFLLQDTLVAGLDVSLSSFRVVGFSLGAQVVGNVGNILNGALPRITGLDPAGNADKTIERETLRVSPTHSFFKMLIV